MKHSELSAYTQEQLSEYTHYQLSKGLILRFITDRTASDVERWRELRDKGWSGMTDAEQLEWLGEIETTPAATKGMYTHNDLNRVERAVDTVIARFREAGYEPPELMTKTDWTYTDTFSVTDMQRYLSNVAALRNFLVVYRNTPKVPDTNVNLNYRLANDIEKILSDVYSIATNIIESRYYSGEIISGEV